MEVRTRSDAKQMQKWLLKLLTLCSLGIFPPLEGRYFDVIVAGHKTDTACVENPGMRAYHLCLQKRNFTWFSGGARLCFPTTAKRDFPHFTSLAERRSSTSVHLPSLSKHWAVYAVKATQIKHYDPWQRLRPQRVLWGGFVIITRFTLPLDKYPISQSYTCVLS